MAGNRKDILENLNMIRNISNYVGKSSWMIELRLRNMAQERVNTVEGAHSAVFNLKDVGGNNKIADFLHFFF